MALLTLARGCITGQDGDVVFAISSGNLALDFVGTLGERRDARHEHLLEAGGVAAWLVEAGVLDTPPEADAPGPRRGRRPCARRCSSWSSGSSTIPPNRSRRPSSTVLNRGGGRHHHRPSSCGPTDACSAPARGAAGSSAVARDALVLVEPGDAGAQVVRRTRPAPTRSWTVPVATAVAGARWPAAATGPRPRPTAPGGVPRADAQVGRSGAAAPAVGRSRPPPCGCGPRAWPGCSRRARSPSSC